MSTKQKPKYDYYNVDTGFIPAPVKLTFSNDVFAEILRDHNITTKDQALELGMAEVHTFTEGKKHLIIMVFDYEECLSADPSLLVSTICHESVHCAHRVMDYAGDDRADWGEETFCYLTDHIAKQVYVAFQVESQKRAGKNNRAVSKQKSKRSGRTVLQVGEFNQRGAGSSGDTQPTGEVRGVENSNGETQPPSSHRV